MKVVTVDEMRAIERRAEQEYGLTSTILMEHAGRSVAEALRACLGGVVAGLEVLVLVGPGNNGGDGRVLARYLQEWGARLTLWNWREQRLEIDDRQIPVDAALAPLRAALARADVVADALLGTGHSRPLDPTMRQVLADVRQERERRPELLVLAVDLPSGLNADTGEIDAGALAADLTVTLGFPKIGQLLFPGGAYVGELVSGSIGLPNEMQIAAGIEMLDPALLRPALPARPLESNKGTFGRVMVLAGSSLYIGAAFLATAAAARIGAGLVTLATTAERAPFYATKLAEATYSLLPDEQHASPSERAQHLLDSLDGYRAMVIGPGLGQSDETRAFLEAVFAGITRRREGERPRLIVDADGLNTLATFERWWERLPPETVLTPHPGEMARLLGGQKVSGGGHDRIGIICDAARAWGHVVVLKGAATLIAAPDGALRINWPGNPAMATAGTGDVLSGTIGGLLAQGMEPFEAACAGVYLHSRAGLRISERIGDAGLLASDLLGELPLALRDTKRS